MGPVRPAALLFGPLVVSCAVQGGFACTRANDTRAVNCFEYYSSSGHAAASRITPWALTARVFCSVTTRDSPICHELVDIAEICCPEDELAGASAQS